MRERFHAPIEYDREANAYRLGAPRPGPRYELPGLWFSADEAYALLTMHTLLAELQPGLLEPHLAPLQGAPARDPRRRAGVEGHREADPRVPARAAHGARRAFWSGCERGVEAPAALGASLQPARRSRDRARDLAAAARALPRQLVRRRVLPPARGSAQLRGRCAARGRAARGAGEGGPGDGARRAPGERLRHLRGARRAVGEAALHARGRALGGRAELASQPEIGVRTRTAATSSRFRTRTSASS